MADKEEKRKPAEGSKTAAPRKSRKKAFLLAGIGLIGLAGAAFGVFTYFHHGKGQGPKEAQASAAPAKAAGEGHAVKGEKGKNGAGNLRYFPLDPFILNLADTESNRYLKISITLEMNDALAVKTAEERVPRIRDAMILLMSSLTYGDVHSVEGKITLQSEIQNRLNDIIAAGSVKRVYFTDLVVQ